MSTQVGEPGFSPVPETDHSTTPNAQIGPDLEQLPADQVAPTTGEVEAIVKPARSPHEIDISGEEVTTGTKTLMSRRAKIDAQRAAIAGIKPDPTTGSEHQTGVVSALRDSHQEVDAKKQSDKLNSLQNAADEAGVVPSSQRYGSYPEEPSEQAPAADAVGTEKKTIGEKIRGIFSRKKKETASVEQPATQPTEASALTVSAPDTSESRPPLEPEPDAMDAGGLINDAPAPETNPAAANKGV